MPTLQRMFSPAIHWCHPCIKVTILMILTSQTMWVEVRRMRRKAWRRCWVSPGGCTNLHWHNLPLHSHLLHSHLLKLLKTGTPIRVPRKDLKWAAKLLQDLSAGKKVKLPASASREEVPFAVPDVMAGETDCALCHQTFKSTRSLRRHMKTHTGETGYSCQCGKVLASRVMLDLHQKSCGWDKSHWCKACNLGYTTKQALVHHLKAKHGPAPTKEELTCATCGKEFKLVKTMWEHMASHKGPFYCHVPGCGVGPFSLPKRLNWHMAEKHDFVACKE